MIPKKRLSNLQGGYLRNVLPACGLLCPSTQTKQSKKYGRESPCLQPGQTVFPPHQTTFLVATATDSLYYRKCSPHVRCSGQLISGGVTACSKVGDAEQCAESVNYNITVEQIVATFNWKQTYFRFSFLSIKYENSHLKRRVDINEDFRCVYFIHDRKET